MKNIILSVLCVGLFSINQLNAQCNTIVDRYNKTVPLFTSGYYYKDTNHLLDPFVGHYKYQNGNEIFEVILQKKEQSLGYGNDYCEDLIVGGYRYVDENGVEQVNLLNDLANNYPNGDDHVISGDIILLGDALGCDNCLPTDKRLWVSIRDPQSGPSFAKFVVRKIIHNGQEALEGYIAFTEVNIKRPTDPEPVPPRFKAQDDMILIKQ